MANLSEELKIRILADISGLKSDMEQAKRVIGDFEKKTESAAQSSKEMGGAFAFASLKLNLVVDAVSKLAGALPNLISDQIKASKETKLWASRLDVAADSFSQLEIVARKFGGSTDDIGDSIKDLNERIADAARGNKTYEDALNMVGLASQNLIDLPVEEQFLKVADAIGKMNNAGDRNFVTAELMADAGFRLIPMFQQGEKSIRGMMKAADDLNQSLDSSQIEAFADLDRAFIELELSTDTLAKTIGESLAPVLEESARLAGLVAEEMTAMFAKQKEIKDLDVASQLSAQNDKLAGLKMALVSAQGELAGFQDSWMKAIGFSGAGEKLILEGNVDRLRMSIATTTAEIEKLKSAKAGSGLAVSKDGSPPVPDPSGSTNLGAKLRQEQLDAILSAEFEHMLEVGELQKQADAEKVARDEENLNYLFEQLLAEGDIKRKAREQEEAEHAAWLDRMFGMDAKHQEMNRKLWMSGWQGKMMVASKFMGQMSSMMASNSRKQFEIGKAAAIAQVAIDTPKAAMSAYSAMSGIPLIGPALGIAAAAAAISSGASQIQNIKSQTMGGGSVNAGGISGGGGAGAGGGQQQAAPENVLDATFNIQGSSVSADSVRQLGSSLNEYIEDGFRIRSVQVV